MNTVLDISAYPKFSDIKRKVELMPLTIDYRYEVANWPFQVIHTDTEGNELLEVPRANGNFRLSNERYVYPAGHASAGVRLPVGETEIAADPEIEGSVAVVGIPEFEFLRGMLMAPGIDPLVLGGLRVDSSDQRGNFSDYAKLMQL